MRVAVVVSIAALLCAGFAGCSDKPDEAPEVPAAPMFVDARVLPSQFPATAALAPLKYKESPAIATGFMGEPTLIADSLGSLYLTFPGCPSDFDSCNNGPLFRSDDDGATWTYLNLNNGSLAKDGHDANGDAMVAIDAAGTLYASNLGGGIPVWSSTDRGASWTFRADVVPSTDGADRQWSWGGPSGMVVEEWMATSPARAAAVSVSRDGGESWEGPDYFDDPIGWIGPVVGSPDGQHLAIPYTKPLDTETVPDPTGLVTGLVVLLVDPFVELRLLASDDGGATWEVRPTGYVITKNPAALQWSGTLMAPAIARTGSGKLVYAWSEQAVDPTLRASGSAAAVFTMTSGDNGKTWSPPHLISGARTGIMPWVVGGSGDRYAVGYYASSDVVVDHGYEGTWDVESVVVDGTQAATSIVAASVHTGGICAQGGTCLLRLSDRSMLDFLGGTLLPDGRVAWAYASSDGVPGPALPLGILGLGSGTSIHVAVQTPGTGLL